MVSEAYDKWSVIGLTYPAGHEGDQLAHEDRIFMIFRGAMIKKTICFFQPQVGLYQLVHNAQQKERSCPNQDLSASFQAVMDILMAKTEKALEKYQSDSGRGGRCAIIKGPEKRTIGGWDSGC